MRGELAVDDIEAEDARWDRLLDARDAVLCDLGAITTEADEIVWDLDGQLAEVDHDAVVEGVERLVGLVDGIGEEFEELARLTWAFEDEAPLPDLELRPLPVPYLDRAALFSPECRAGAGDDGVDDPAIVALDRVGQVGEHMRVLGRAVVEALDEALAIAEFGDVSGARQQRRHAQACAAELRPTFGLWRDVLEGASP